MGLRRKESTVQFDIGLVGLGLLVVSALVFGGLAQVAGRPGTRWQWLIAAVAWFTGGLFASEVVWGTLTEQQIQPIIDGLAFDEALLGGLIVGVAVVIATRYLTGGSPFHHRPTAA
jgi:hypothetical protein